jgi:hypothetical protein
MTALAFEQLSPHCNQGVEQLQTSELMQRSGITAAQPICLLPCSKRRETLAPPKVGNQMKTITLRIPPVKAAMLQDLQKTHKQFRKLEALVLGLIREEYGKKSGK